MSNLMHESGDKRNKLSEKSTGVLLLNLGTPDSPEPHDVGRYLKQFLMDKWVIDIPWLLRWILVHILIVPKRKYASSEAYKQIWTSQGSPLLVNLESLAVKLRPLLAGIEVETAMRYGRPSIDAGLTRLKAKNVSEVIVFALYPQYAESSTRSSIEECRRAAKKIGLSAELRFYPAFYDHPEFIAAYADILRPKIEAEKPDHVLFSFHGLPERHIKRTDRSGGQHCLKQSNCCDQIVDANRDCYRAQSYATARALGRMLKLSPEKWSVSFQSRLGRTPWIRPYTDFVLVELPPKGVKSLAVACPSFAADCLETLEEIAIRGATEFKAAGGEYMHVLDCPNADERWAKAVSNMITEFHRPSKRPAH